jgi:hypothetical protein
MVKTFAGAIFIFVGRLPHPFVKVALGAFGFAQMQAVGDLLNRERGFLSQACGQGQLRRGTLAAYQQARADQVY